ncbi:MAG: GGDEF domain-containing protein [Planctomycetia bacterium]|nr:GGDEF domain-containing protein [Planctomycetia bacterium]
MAGKIPIRVLLLSADCDVLERWAKALGDDAFRAARGGDPLAGALPDVVVTDSSRDEMPPALAARIKRGAAAAIRMAAPGRSAAARRVDVVLPPDATDRELALACRLAGEAARLRRRVHRASVKRRRLLRLAETDALTGLPNRRAWERELAARLRPSAAGRRHCLAIVDLDCFKRFNDVHGHAAGDRLLAAVGRALRAAVREDDFVSRLGGDEFGILLTGVEDESAAAIVERVRQRIGERIEGAPEPLRASAGYVVFTASPQANGGALFEAADRALAAAKQAGRDCSQAAVEE